jgi:PH and SEC7 domain-containing protein
MLLQTLTVCVVGDALLAAKLHQELNSEHSLSRWASSQSLLPKDDASGPADVDALGQERARQCWIEDEEFLAKDKIAEWLGGHGAVNAVALKYWMDRFDFTGLRLDYAFR